MTSLGLYVLSLILWVFPPGKSPRLSVVEVPQGTPGAHWDPCFRGISREKPHFTKQPDGTWKAKTERLCTHRTADDGAWVRTETREEGAARLEPVAQALADAATAGADGWPEGATDLARAETSVFGWSMGFKEGPQTGRVRGPAFEACLADLIPEMLHRFAPDELKGLPTQELADRVTGRDYDSLRLCFDIGTRVLVAARKAEKWRCKRWTRPHEEMAFALYVNGNTCSTAPPQDWAEVARYDTLLKFRGRQGTTFPDWYKPPTGSAGAS